MLPHNIINDHQYILHHAGAHVEVGIPDGFALVPTDLSVAEIATIQDCKAPIISVAYHASENWLDHHVIL